MVQDWGATLKILLVVVASSVLLSAFVAFNEDRVAAGRAWFPIFILCLVLGALQIFQASYAPLIVIVGLVLEGVWFWRRRPRRR